MNGNGIWSREGVTRLADYSDPRMDIQHKNLREKGPFVEHCFGPNVYIINSPRALTLTAEIGRLDDGHPRLDEMVPELTHIVMEVIINQELPLAPFAVRTSMADIYPDEDVAFRTEMIDPSTWAGFIELPRAGSHTRDTVLRMLKQVLDYHYVWYDHFPGQRVNDEHGHVAGVASGQQKFSERNLAPYKDEDGNLLPDGQRITKKLICIDIMLATGGSAVNAVETYLAVREKYDMVPDEDVIFGFFIATPEGIRELTGKFPGIKIYTLRLDRGRSTDLSVLQKTPGSCPDIERGLTDKGYVYPGAGGMGEKLANAHNSTPVVTTTKTK